jgi:hypothetical protein
MPLCLLSGFFSTLFPSSVQVLPVVVPVLATWYIRSKKPDEACAITLFAWHRTPWRNKGNLFFSLDSERKTPSGTNNGPFAACVQENYRDAGREVFFRRHLDTR